MTVILRQSFLAVLALFFTAFVAMAQTKQETEDLETFLEVTGFDVALESIRLSADTAPEMLGLQADDFGSEWSRLVSEVFATDIMHDLALELLGVALEDDLRDHAIEFYASDLGQRLVIVENKSHMNDNDTLKSESGEQIIAGLTRIESPRVDILRRLNTASDVEDSSIAAMQEVQIRFLMTAAAVGIIELQMDEPDLREVMRNQRSELSAIIAESALANAAYTYQAFSDEEMTAYAEALEHPKMQEVYALMNAVQFEIMANRFEEVALRLSQMQPSQDL